MGHLAVGGCGEHSIFPVALADMSMATRTDPLSATKIDPPGDSDRRSLRQLFEFARWCAQPEAASLDWAGLLRNLDAAGMGEALRLNLLATQHLFGQPLPAGVRPTPAALAAEGRFWWRLDHPALDCWLDWQRHWRLQARRLANLPRRLVTPAWYPMKWQQLKRAWWGGGNQGG